VVPFFYGTDADLFLQRLIISVPDVFPAILYLLGMPLAKDFEGKVLFEALRNNYRKKNDIQMHLFTCVPL